ncbi:phosphatidylinositol-glycan biosynthesis class F protein-like [Mytilus californianus]|uniref:phosphatidylinositol-glycan biosynthesis class F protein-like n=1 Tax=Mytilus californianus TaxID=6549 RepID=UPI00224606EA|nr:phosphatidylinositol-glycan biosynthesis class F protein-like [Mytilus californianus]
MSAPMANRLPAKETLNSLLKGHLIFSISTLMLLFFSITNENLFSIVKYRFIVTKLFIFFISVFNIIFYNFLNIQGGTSQRNAGILSKIRIILKNGLLLFCSSIFFHVIAVLFGAPFLESSAETFHFGMTMSATVVLPALCVMGTSTVQWIRIFAQNSPELGAESIVYFSTICSIIGAWLGAFPIPLDWDRPWQEWPITCVVGTLFGYCTGVIIGAAHLYINYYRIKRIKIT